MGEGWPGVCALQWEKWEAWLPVKPLFANISQDPAVSCPHPSPHPCFHPSPPPAPAPDSVVTPPAEAAAPHAPHAAPVFWQS